MKQIKLLKSKFSKRFLAVICVSAMLANSFLIHSFAVANEAEYKTYTLADFGIEEATTFYSDTGASYQQYQIDSTPLDGCAIEGYYNFYGEAGTNYIFFGRRVWEGFFIESKNANSIGFYYNSTNTGVDYGALGSGTLTTATYNANNGDAPDLANITGQDLKIRLEYDIEDLTATSTTVTIKVIINDAYENTFTISGANPVHNGKSVVPYAKKGYQFKVKPCQYETVTLTDFGHEDVVTVEKTNVNKQMSNSLHNYNVEGYYRFALGVAGTSRLIFGNPVPFGNWTAINIAPWNDGTSLIVYYGAGASPTNTTAAGMAKIWLSDYNAVSEQDFTSFYDQEFKMGVKFAFDDPTSSSTNVKLIVTINDVYEQTITFTGVNASYMKGSVAVVSPGANGVPVTAKSIIPVAEELLGITPFDFGVTDKVIPDTVSGLYSQAESLDSTRFVTDITLPAKGSNAAVIFGATDANGTNGVRLSVAGTGDAFDLKLEDNHSEVDYQATLTAAGENALINNEVNLSIATEFIDGDRDGAKDDVLLVLYVNGNQYDNRVFLLKDYVQYFGNYILFQGAGEENPIRLDYELPEKPELTEISLPETFGFAYGTYEGAGLVMEHKHTESFVNTVISQTVELSNTVGSRLNIAGLNSATEGISLEVGANGTLILKAANGEFGDEFTLTPEIAQTTLVGAPVDLKLELYQFGAYTRLGVYINGNLYNSEEFTLNCSSALFGNYIGYYNVDESGYIKLVGETPTLTTLNNRILGIGDGEYTSTESAVLYVDASYTDILVGTRYEHKLKLSQTAEMWMCFGGVEHGQHGIRFTTNANGTISFKPAIDEFTLTGTLTDEIAGVDLVGGEDAYDFAIELLPSGENVKMGLYFNGKLYNNKYFILDGAAGKLGKRLSYRIPKDTDGVITIGTPEAAPVVDESFGKLTFNSYDLETGVYTKGEKASISGSCGLTSLDKMVFSDVVNFSDKAGSEFHIGGSANLVPERAWGGLVFRNIGNGKLTLSAANGAMFTQLTFDSETAGVNLTGDDFELKLSFEYVDYDGDGSEDDVKLGVWFDGKPYNNRWIYLIDKAPDLGEYVLVYLANEETSFSFTTYMPPIDFEEYGFTSNWAEELGLK